jgi:hypothetical protein
METLELLTKNPELARNIKFEVSGSDLLEFGEFIHKRASEEAKTEPKEEEYMTPQQFADALQVSLVTLWSWDNKHITKPLRIGNKKRYRRSDLEKILSEE